MKDHIKIPSIILVFLGILSCANFDDAEPKELCAANPGSQAGSCSSETGLCAPYADAENADCSTYVTFSKVTKIIDSYAPNCTTCHTTPPAAAGTGYSLTSRENALGGGSDNNPNVVAGDPWASFLFLKVWGSNDAPPNATNPPKGSNAAQFSGGKMPIDCSGDACISTNQAHVNEFFCWIAQGAK